MSVIISPSPGRLPSPKILQQLASAVCSGKIIAFPTDTVYGLGATALIPAAARRIYQIKNRPSLKPLQILVDSTETAGKWVEWTPAAKLLARRFWPGGLTLVLRPTLEGRLLTLPEFQTVAIRVPKHPALLKFIEASAVPWVSTSANLSGFPALLEGSEVIKQFEGLADYIIDGGKINGVESTVVDATAVPIRVLREGTLKAAEIVLAGAGE